MPRTSLTATDIYKYFHCPHWPYYDRYATPDELPYKRELSHSALRRQEDGVAHEEHIVSELLQDQVVITAPMSADAEAACAETVALMRTGAAWIYQGTLVDGDWTGRPDLLQRREGKSALGDWYYVPVDVKTTTTIQKYQKMQLAFYATLLEKIQGRDPEEGAILNRQGVCLPFVLAGVQDEFRQIMSDLRSIVIDGKKPDLVLRKSCYDTGVWGRLCEHYAKEANDIALLYKVDVHKLRALRTLNIRTIDQAAAMNPGALADTVKGLTRHSLEVMQQQALSLKNKSVHIREPITLPTHETEIFFDIESDPPSDVDYLYGCLVRSGSKAEYKPFLAKTLEQEGEMWHAFLAWLETLPTEYVVYHFSPYEVSRLGVMENRYGGSEWLERFKANMIDLKEYSSSNITFPLYFYGLKYIAKFLGFQWRGAVIANGGDSVDQFEKYLETHDEAVMQEIVRYNEDDVRATAYLKDWMTSYAQGVAVYSQPYPWKGQTMSRGAQ